MDNVASMAWKLHAIEQTQSWERRRDGRVDGVGRLKLISTRHATGSRTTMISFEDSGNSRAMFPQAFGDAM